MDLTRSGSGYLGVTADGAPELLVDRVALLASRGRLASTSRALSIALRRLSNGVFALLALGGSMLNSSLASAEEDQPKDPMLHERPRGDLASEIPLISTSRPSVTDTSTTVPPGSLQFENGATYINYPADTHSWDLPETLVRVGVSHHTELRFTPPVYLNVRSDGEEVVDSYTDISVGMSHHLVAPGKVDVALIPVLNLPTGGDGASTSGVDPEFRLAWSKTLTPKWVPAGQLGVRWYTDGDATPDLLLTPTLITYYYFEPTVSSFLEYAAFVPDDGPMTHFLQSGVLWVVEKRHQFDARVAVGLNADSPDFLVGFGYSFRLDGLFGGNR